MQTLSERMQEIGQAVYGAGAASSDGSTEPGGGEGEEAGTVEGEFREV